MFIELIIPPCRFSTAQKLDKLGMRGSDTYVCNALSEIIYILARPLLFLPFFLLTVAMV